MSLVKCLHFGCKSLTWRVGYDCRNEYQFKSFSMFEWIDKLMDAIFFIKFDHNLKIRIYHFNLLTNDFIVKVIRVNQKHFICISNCVLNNIFIWIIIMLLEYVFWLHCKNNLSSNIDLTSQLNISIQLLNNLLA